MIYLVDKYCKVCNAVFTVYKSVAKRYSTCSNECKRLNRRRDKNPNWKGGVTKTRKAILSTLEYKNWRKDVFERDNYTCQICTKRGNQNIHAHHIKPWVSYEWLRYTVSNGMTLCESCHRQVHTKGSETWWQWGEVPMAYG